MFFTEGAVISNLSKLAIVSSTVLLKVLIASSIFFSSFA
jgi:hypothetical protein